MTSRIKAFVLIVVAIVLSSKLSAQYEKQNDCLIYEKVLTFLNEREATNDTVYVGVIDPESGDMGTPVRRTGVLRLSFYIPPSKSDFTFGHLRPWFSDLLRDTSLIDYTYSSNSEDSITCSFSGCLKYQYRNYDDIYFTKEDYTTEFKGYDTIHYQPMRLTFSKILYSTSGEFALVFAKIYAGMGRGGNIALYGFKFRKRGDDWVIEKSEVEML